MDQRAESAPTPNYKHVMTGVVILAVCVGASVAIETHNRRVLLHDDIDIAHVIQNLQTEVDKLKSENMQIQNQNTQIQSQNTQMQSQNTQLQSQITQIQSQNTQIQSQIIQIQSQNTQIQSQNTQLQVQNTHLQSQNVQIQNRVSHLESTCNGSGSTYVRWGRTTCPANGTTLAYSGYMGGGHRGNDDPGAVVNYLCLTADPMWDHYSDDVYSFGRVYGVEYEFWVHRSDGAAQFLGTNLFNQDAPCAVCHSPRSATMMVPGRNQCYPGWTKEYSGYLVSGSNAPGPSSNTTSEYICLDRRPEAVVGGGTDDEGTKLYLVEGVCGKSLACPPYINGRELTCVVCTK